MTTGKPSMRAELVAMLELSDLLDDWAIPDTESRGDSITETGDPMTGAIHHRTARKVAPGVWDVARPLRDTSPWRRWKQERACRKSTGHCWHPEALIDWFCCLCAAETDGMPPQDCVHCRAAGSVSS